MELPNQLMEDFDKLGEAIEKENAEFRRLQAMSESQEEMCRLCSPVTLRAAALCDQLSEALRRAAKWMNTEELRLNRGKRQEPDN